jgi:hypothetical protein
MVTVPPDPEDCEPPDVPTLLLPQADRAVAAETPATTTTQMLRLLLISLLLKAQRRGPE